MYVFPFHLYSPVPSLVFSLPMISSSFLFPIMVNSELLATWAFKPSAVR